REAVVSVDGESVLVLWGRAGILHAQASAVAHRFWFAANVDTNSLTSHGLWFRARSGLTGLATGKRTVVAGVTLAVLVAVLLVGVVGARAVVLRVDEPVGVLVEDLVDVRHGGGGAELVEARLQ